MEKVIDNLRETSVTTAQAHEALKKSHGCQAAESLVGTQAGAHA